MEQEEQLATGQGVRITRIVSHGQVSPADFWYDQSEAEWVALLAGQAHLEIAGEPRPRRLVPGDWLLLPAGCRHRVAWTAPETETVWLAIFFPDTIKKTTPLPGGD
jgi:cupin 2 domain-containing protein